MTIVSYLAALDDNFMLQAKTVDGKIDLIISIVCILLALVISHFIIKKYFKSAPPPSKTVKNLISYLGIRSVFPLTVISIFGLNYIRFLLMTDKSSIIYQALIWVALWMLIIRIIVGCIIFSLPKTRFKYNLSNLIALFIWLSFLIWWTGADNAIKQYLKMIKFKLGPMHFTALSLTYAVITLIIVLSLSIWINKLIESKIHKISYLDSTFQHIIIRLSKFIISFIILFGILFILGVDLTTLSIFSGALGVGLGLGLQKLLANFFSGIMILVDRSVKLGDRLVVGPHTGYVTKITSRHIIMRSLDNSDILVPNSKFISDIIINQSYTDTTLLMTLNVRITYSSDLNLALQLLVDAASAWHDLDISKPSKAGIDSFDEYSISLTLYTWLKNPALAIIEPKTAIYLKIRELFTRYGIEIALPRQEVSLHKIK